MDVGRYVQVLKRAWKLIAAVAIIGAVIAGTYSMLATPQYRATSTVFFYLNGGDSTTQLLQGSTYAQNQVQSFSMLAQQPIVLDPVIKELNLNDTSVSLSKKITTDVPLDTVLLNVSVTDPDPAKAAAIANGVVTQLSKTITDLSPSGAAAAAGATPASPSGVSVRASTVAPASVPEFAYTPNTKQNVAIGLLFGLALGAAIAVLRDLLNNRVNSEEIVKAMTSAPVIGNVPFDSEATSSPAVYPGQHTPRAEAFRLMGVNFEYLNFQNKINCLAVTSSLPGEGKSTVALNLALAMSQHRRVVLIDADLRRPTVSKITGLEGSIGLSGVLSGKGSLQEALQPWRRGQFTVLTAGQIPPNPSELLGSDAMKRTLDQLGEQFDLIIIDTPPLLAVSDSAILSKLTDGAVVVVNAKRTKRQELEQSLDTIEKSGGDVVGVVMNKSTQHAAHAYYGTYESREPDTRQANSVISKYLGPVASSRQ